MLEPLIEISVEKLPDGDFRFGTRPQVTHHRHLGGSLLGTDDDGSRGATRGCQLELLADAGMPEPVLDRDAFILIQELDWAIVDIGKDMAETGLPAYLHGRFVPMMRLKYSPPGSRPAGSGSAPT